MQILPPSDSTLIRCHLAARAHTPALAFRDRRWVPTPAATNQALARQRQALRASLVTYIPYQQGEWWVLLQAQRAPGTQDMTITCFNPPPGAAGKLRIMRFIRLCERQCGFRVHNPRLCFFTRFLTVGYSQ